jgi:acyl dehydratase
MAQTLLAHELIAYNTATDSENKIHDDDVAARFGFTGGLVPGVDVYAYLCQPALALWGDRFLRSSRVSVRFDAPVYDGQATTVTSVLDDDGTLRAEAHTAEGRRAFLEATLVDQPPTPPSTTAAPGTGERPPASPEVLPEGVALGSYTTELSAEAQASYLRDIRDPTSPVAGLGAVHPGWLLRQANYLLSRNVTLGPWIHVGSVIDHLAPAPLGQPLAVQGFTRRCYEHKGHRFVLLAVVVYGPDGQPLCSVDHTAIYEPRQVRELAG